MSRYNPTTIELQLKVLREARKLIQQGWCQGSAARNTRGDPVNVRAPSAVCWCATGSVTKVINDGNIGTSLNDTRSYAHLSDAVCARLSAAILAGAMLSYPIIQYNDHPSTTQKDIIEMFDRAIEQAAA